MKLHQLRYLAAVVQNGLNITTAARKLHTSQPGVSKQLKLLEDELGFPLFEREGRNPPRDGGRPGSRGPGAAHSREAQNIRRLSSDLKDERSGSLSIGTTHNAGALRAAERRAALSVAPIRTSTCTCTRERRSRLPSSPSSTASTSRSRPVATSFFPGLVLLPCYRWSRKVIVPHAHPLATERELSLKALARYPLVTYTFSFGGRSSLPALFESAGLKLKVALTASDADVIKTYVRLGLGVGIVASMALDPEEDRDLAVLDASNLFAPHVTWIGFRRGRLLRGFMYDFLKAFAPHLDRRLIGEAIRAGSGEALAQLFVGIHLPER